MKCIVKENDEYKTSPFMAGETVESKKKKYMQKNIHSARWLCQNSELKGTTESTQDFILWSADGRRVSYVHPEDTGGPGAHSAPASLSLLERGTWKTLQDCESTSIK